MDSKLASLDERSLAEVLKFLLPVYNNDRVQKRSRNVRYSVRTYE